MELHRKIVVRPENRVGGSGILQALSPELELSIFDLASLMIVMSDNIATNEVIDLLGMERVRAFCEERDCRHTWLWRKMMDKTVTHPPHMPEGTPPNATCAGDLGRLMEAIAAGNMVSRAASGKMVQIMAGQRLGRLKTLLPHVNRNNPYTAQLALPPEGKVVVASKGGTLAALGCAHDAAIFYLPDGRYCVVVICTRSRDVEAATGIINRVGLAVYNAMK